MTKIAIVEDNKVALKSLKEKLSLYPDISIVITAENGKSGIEKIEQNSDIDLIFMDIEMPVMNGIDATFVMKQKYPEIKIVVITVYDDDDHIFRAIQAGADSYILKDTKAEKIHETIIDTMAGGAVMSPSIAVKTLKLLRKSSDAVQPQSEMTENLLSARESEILELLSKGLTNKVISEQLFISPFTVKRHIENIYQKLQAHNRTELLQKARDRNLF
ncbi:response regulator [Chryseobacterium caseinilyticum]|uniref:Response regulator transcription factor n=1 Tax=Chryseobacterium caseinilyticum TaxID=2771428 RepID=A0ABR8Z8L2_9FLAO|nr:response regulator transcription factor [Chryseobacterium caseinilyticum]MBD8081638.1 response regulator transcription factor [Chryseobacterium caseinilyticum]